METRLWARITCQIHVKFMLSNSTESLTEIHYKSYYSLIWIHSFHKHFKKSIICRGLPRWCSGKESTCQWGFIAPTNAPAGDLGLIPRLRRSPGGGNGTHSNILAWRIPWTKEPGGLQSMGSQKSQTRLVHALHITCRTYVGTVKKTKTITLTSCLGRKK